MLPPVVKRKSTEIKESIAGGVIIVFIKQTKNNSSQTLKPYYEHARGSQSADHEEEQVSRFQVQAGYLEALFNAQGDLRFCTSDKQPEDAAAGPQTT